MDRTSPPSALATALLRCHVEPIHHRHTMLSFFGSKGNRSATETGNEPSSASAPAVVGGDELSKETGIVLDTLSSLLQVYGKYAFDTELHTGDEIRTAVHGWRMHSGVGAQRPDHADDKPSAGVFYRDWKGLVHFFNDHRRDEAKYVTRVLNDFRDVTWAFVSAVHTVVVEEQEESRIARDQLGRMRVAADSNSTDLMKREALAVVGVMEKLIEHRKERQQEQFSVLADKLKSLGRELDDARRESSTDGLTGLHNRKAFDDYITRSIELHTLLGQAGCLMMIDIDRFKQVNDTFGHPTGDAAIRQISNTLSKTFLRRVDFVARFGGDEFVVLLQECNMENAAMLGERLRRIVGELPPLEVPAGLEPPKITLSVGIGELKLGDTQMDWIKRADTALYQAKRAGRDRVHSLNGES